MEPPLETVLVTGGAGYIGSHACKALRRAGYRPVTYDNLIYGHDWAVKWGPFEQGNILDRTRLEEVIAKYEPAAIMHFAAFAYVGESVTDPGKYYRNNVLGSLTLMEAARDHGIRRFVFSSTCATYGIPDRLPIGEDTHMAFHKKCGLRIEDMVRSRWIYRKLRNFRAGIEAGISCLKRAYGLARCTWRGIERFKAYVWSSVVAYNLALFARLAVA